MIDPSHPALEKWPQFTEKAPKVLKGKPVVYLDPVEYSNMIQEKIDWISNELDTTTMTSKVYRGFQLMGRGLALELWSELYGFTRLMSGGANPLHYLIFF